MREILFRAQRVDNGEWVEGFYIYDTHDKQPRIVIEREYSTGTFFEAYAPRVLSKTVGQYTGFTDKNGKKIFEGDIVKFNHPAYFEHIGKVVFDEEDLSFYLTEYGTDDWFGWISEFYEVIGNIHDNPELLEAKE